MTTITTAIAAKHLVYRYFLLAFIIGTVFNTRLSAQTDTLLFKSPQIAMDKGNYDQAYREYDEIKQQFENSGNQLKSDYFFAACQIILIDMTLGRLNRAVDLSNKIKNNIGNYANDLVRLRFESTYGQLLLELGEIDEALVHFEKAYRLSDTLNNTNESINTRLYISNTLTNQGNFDEAIAYLNEALKLSIAGFGPRHFRVATVYSFIAQNFERQNKVEAALSHYKKFTEITIQELDSTYLSNKVYTEYDSLSSFYQDVIEIEQRDKIFGRIHPADLPAFINIAYQLIEFGDLSLAEKFLGTLAETSKEGKNPLIEATAKSGQAGVFHRLGQRNHAISLYKEALDIYKENNSQDNYSTAWVYHNMAVTYDELGNYNESLRLNNLALEIRQAIYGENHHETASSYLNIATNLHKLQRFDEAIVTHRKSISGGYNDQAFAYYSIASTFLEMGKADSAKKSILKSLALTPRVEDPYYSHFTSVLAQCYIKEAKIDSALYYLGVGSETNYDGPASDLDSDETIEIGKIRNPLHFLQSELVKASALKVQYDRTQDFQLLEKANEVFDLCKTLIFEIRSSFIQEIDNLDFYKLTNEVSEKAIENLFTCYSQKNDLQYLESAFWFADMNKSQIVFDAIRTKQIASSPVDETLAEWSSLKGLIKSEQAKLRSLRVQGASQVEIKSVSAKLNQLNTILRELLLEIKASQPSLHSYLSNQVNKQDIRQLYRYLKKNNRGLIQFFWGTEYLYTFTLGNEGKIRVDRLNFESTPDLNEQIDRFNTFIKSPQSVDSVSMAQFVNDGSTIFQLLLAKGMKEFKSNSFTIIPDGPFSALPFEALLVDQIDEKMDLKELPYLIRSHEISYASSAALLLENSKHNRQEYSEEYKAWAPFSEPNGQVSNDSEILRDYSLVNLPGTTNELRVLSSLFKGTNYMGKEANEENFKENITNARIVHIATHGIMNDVDPLQSNLLFGEIMENDSSEDNKLYMFEIYGMALNSDLAVLTACNTGSGKQEQGEGTISLARAFKYAGAKSVLMSLWLANDQSTSDIIGDFYRNFADKQGKGEALRNAKLNYLSQADNLASHPFYWSHLILSGDSSSLSSSGIPRGWLWGILILTLVIVVATRVKKRA